MLKHHNWYWLEVVGPDGHDFMLAQYLCIFGHECFRVPDDADAEYEFDGASVHKWQIIQIHKILLPNGDEQ